MKREPTHSMAGAIAVGTLIAACALIMAIIAGAGGS